MSYLRSAATMSSDWRPPIRAELGSYVISQPDEEVVGPVEQFGDATLDITATITAAGTGSWGPPPNIIATPISATQVDLSWDAVPTATGYRIWRDGAVVAANNAGTAFSDLTVVASTSYSYEVASIR